MAAANTQHPGNAHPLPAHPKAPSFAAQPTPPDQFLKRNSKPLPFAGSNNPIPEFNEEPRVLTTKIGHANEVMDTVGNTWLHYAALSGDIDLAKRLIKQEHVDLTLTNKQGLSAYTACASSSQPKIAAILRDAGAKLQIFNHTDAHGNVDDSKPFMHPSDVAKKYSGDPETIRFFLNEEKKALAKILSEN